MNPNVVNNFVKVSQERNHVIVKNAGGLQGIPGPAGAGLQIDGSVNTYADLPQHLRPDDAGEAFFVQADGKLYVWSGTAWPADGEGSQFEGPQGPQGVQGPQGIQGPQGEPGTDANVINTLSQSTTDAYSAKYINDNNYTKTETDTLLAAKAPANEVAYIGQEVAGGSTLIGTSDIAPGAITTSKVADGAITSDKIDSATFYYESPTQTISSIPSLGSITVRLSDIIPNYSTIVANNIIVGAFVVFTGGGTGAATYKMQGIGGSLDQQYYGFVLNNNLEQALGPWYYKVILTLLKKQSS